MKRDYIIYNSLAPLQAVTFRGPRDITNIHKREFGSRTYCSASPESRRMQPVLELFLEQLALLKDPMGISAFNFGVGFSLMRA